MLVLIASADLLALANQYTTKLQVRDKIPQVNGDAREYARWLDMAVEPIEEYDGNRGWDLPLGLVNSEGYFQSEVESQDTRGSTSSAPSGPRGTSIGNRALSKEFTLSRCESTA